jgi:predicted flap endonuclease-1-like 5' DNA nuclease
MANIEDIEGVGPAIAQKMRDAGITTTDALLDKAATKKGREALADVLGLDAKRMLRFVNHADLMRIKGIGGETSELLEAAGVDSVPELAQRNPENLHAAMVQANEQKNVVRRVSALSQVQGFVEQAKAMERVVSH